MDTRTIFMAIAALAGGIFVFISVMNGEKQMVRDQLATMGVKEIQLIWAGPYGFPYGPGMANIGSGTMYIVSYIDTQEKYFKRRCVILNTFTGSKFKWLD